MHRLALGVLTVIAIVWQGAAFYDLYRVTEGDGIPATRIETRSFAPLVADPGEAARAAGLAAGDRIVRVNGAPYRGWNTLRRAAASGPLVEIEYARNGQAGLARVPVQRNRLQLGPMGYLTLGIMNVLTPIAALAIGFGVAWIRPRDRGAWFLLFLLIGFVSISGLFRATPGQHWPAPIAATLAIWQSFFGSTWGMWMMLFGLLVPNRAWLDLKAPWLKWAILAPVFVFAAAGAISVVARNENFALGQGWAERDWGQIPFWTSAVAIGLFFMAQGMRGGMDPDADTRRRARLIWIGSGISLAPLFVVIVVSQILGKTLFSDELWFLWVPPLLLMFLFPVTLAYVIVVHRAMDIRVVVRQGLQYALARRGAIVLRVLIILVAIALASTTILDPASSRPAKLRALAGTVAAVAISGRMLDWLLSWIDRRFFREAVNAERVLTELGESVRGYVEAEPLLKRVADVVAETLHIQGVGMLLERPGGLELAYATGTPTPEELRLPLASKSTTFGAMSLGPKKSEEPYSAADIRLLSTVAGQAGLALENSKLTDAVAAEVAKRERLNRDLEIAREVQERLFPQRYPAVAGVEYAGRCRPALSIGGDYYDFIEIPGGGLGIAIGDVSGKGVPAALLMASLQASLRGQALAGERDLAKLMANVNRLIFDASHANRYATFFYGLYEPSTRQLSYVNAGHNPPIVIRGSEVIPLTEGGPVVGLVGIARYTMGAITLAPGDLWVGFTDGVSEAMNAADDEWGEENLAATARAAGERSADEIITAIMTGADAFAAGAPQHDDMTLSVVKIVA